MPSELNKCFVRKRNFTSEEQEWLSAINNKYNLNVGNNQEIKDNYRNFIPENTRNKIIAIYGNYEQNEYLAHDKFNAKVKEKIKKVFNTIMPNQAKTNNKIDFIEFKNEIYKISKAEFLNKKQQAESHHDNYQWLFQTTNNSNNTPQDTKSVNKIEMQTINDMRTNWNKLKETITATFNQGLEEYYQKWKNDFRDEQTAKKILEEQFYNKIITTAQCEQLVYKMIDNKKIMENVKNQQVELEKTAVELTKESEKISSNLKPLRDELQDSLKKLTTIVNKDKDESNINNVTNEIINKAILIEYKITNLISEIVEPQNQLTTLKTAIAAIEKTTIENEEALENELKIVIITPQDQLKITENDLTAINEKLKATAEKRVTLKSKITEIINLETRITDNEAKTAREIITEIKNILPIATKIIEIETQLTAIETEILKMRTENIQELENKITEKWKQEKIKTKEKQQVTAIKEISKNITEIEKWKLTTEEITKLVDKTIQCPISTIFENKIEKLNATITVLTNAVDHEKQEVEKWQQRSKTENWPIIIEAKKNIEETEEKIIAITKEITHFTKENSTYPQSDNLKQQCENIKNLKNNQKEVETKLEKLEMEVLKTKKAMHKSLLWLNETNLQATEEEQINIDKKNWFDLSQKKELLEQQIDNGEREIINAEKKLKYDLIAVNKQKLELLTAQNYENDKDVNFFHDNVNTRVLTDDNHSQASSSSYKWDTFMPPKYCDNHSQASSSSEWIPNYISLGNFLPHDGHFQTTSQPKPQTSPKWVMTPKSKLENLLKADSEKNDPTPAKFLNLPRYPGTSTIEKYNRESYTTDYATGYPPCKVKTNNLIQIRNKEATEKRKKAAKMTN